MYYFLGASLLLAALLTLNILISMTASILWRVFERRSQNWSAQQRTRLIFALRVFPLFIAVILTFAFLIPSYILFEPNLQEEKVTAKLAFPAFISIIGIAIALYRVLGTWRQTRKLIKNWLKCSKPIFVENISLPVYRIRHQFPVIALVSAFRPKMFIAEQVFESLNENELAAAIKHECGHLAAHDNFKRILLRVCRDLLVFPMGKKLERAWAENSESAADEFAAQTDSKTALNLAAALVKIAKIVPPNVTPTMPIGAFLVETDSIDVTFRVHHLIKLSENSGSSQKQSIINSRIIYISVITVAFILTLFLATNYDFLQSIHALSEKIVDLLQ